MKDLLYCCIKKYRRMVRCGLQKRMCLLLALCTLTSFFLMIIYNPVIISGITDRSKCHITSHEESFIQFHLNTTWKKHTTIAADSGKNVVGKSATWMKYQTLATDVNLHSRCGGPNLDPNEELYVVITYNTFVTIPVLWTNAATLEQLLNLPLNDRTGKSSASNGTFRILWYNPPPLLKRYRKAVLYSGFEKCRYNNCNMSYDRNDATASQAIIFDGRKMPRNLSFTRPADQVWIFAAHEAPISYGAGGDWWYKNNHYTFNWTMTYNKDNTDIFLPYGEILKHKIEVKRDFKSIALNKTKTLLMISSNCYTHLKRQEYVKKLQKYIDVEVLGHCGKKWNCGVHYAHDDCFQLLNTTYTFYLAFENTFCHQYFTEKFYDNFNYDLIMLTRGGSNGEARKLFPKGTYISTDDFKSINDLGNYLRNLSVDKYADLLKRKSQFYSPGYLSVYQRAICDICERMNFLDKYAKTVKNIKEWAFEPQPCLTSKNVTDIR